MLAFLVLGEERIEFCGDFEWRLVIGVGKKIRIHQMSFSRECGMMDCPHSLLVPEVLSVARALDGGVMKRSFEDERAFVLRENEQRFRIDPGFVPNMRVSASWQVRQLIVVCCTDRCLSD